MPSHARRSNASTVLTLLMALTLLASPGCVTETAGSKPKRNTRSQIPDPPPDNPGRPTATLDMATDPCADRMHAISGPLLMYYALNRKLPANLDELRAIAGPDPNVEFTCPVSGKPYVYEPRGLPRGQGRPGALVLFDAEPSHSGMRWAVAAEEPTRAGQSLITHVVAEPELTFHDNALPPAEPAQPPQQSPAPPADAPQPPGQ